MIIDHHDQQIVLRKTRILELCFGTNVGTNQAKIEKISIPRAIRFKFLRSPVSAIRCEANKQIAIFSGASHQNRSYLDNISTNWWYIVGFQQGNCSSKVTDENFKITLQILQVLTPNFHSNSISALWEGWLQCIASVMQGLLTPRNAHLQNRPSHFARIWEIKIFLFF